VIEHLTKNQVEDYCRRRLRPEDLVSLSDHLGECEACRRRIDEALDEAPDETPDETMNEDAAFFALRFAAFGEAGDVSSQAFTPSHPTIEQTTGFVDETLSAEELQIVADHLTRCDKCALAVYDLRIFKNQAAASLEREYKPARPLSDTAGPRLTLSALRSLFRRSPVLAFGAAITVLILISTSWFIWRSQRERPMQPENVVAPDSSPQPAQVPPAQPPTQIVALLNDGGGQVILDQQGALSGADELPSPYRSLLKNALAKSRIEPSPLVKGLTRPSSPLMGGEQESIGFSVIEPVGKVVMPDRPIFRWSSMRGVTSYVVEVYDNKFNLVMSSPELTNNSWTPLQSLARGEVYTWQVKAIKEGQEFKSPRPPAPQARFRVLDKAKAGELGKAKLAWGSSHLLMGLLYARAGLMNESEQELRILQKANPDSDIARRLLNQVQASRR